MKIPFIFLVISTTALADIGKVSLLDGKASRSPKEGAAVALMKGSSIELNDTIRVGEGAHLKLELTDGSVIALDSKSEFRIDEAMFEGQERKGFSGFLQLGSLWTRVKKSLTGAKFQVSTERAVAGVRGTVFRIDAETFLGKTEDKRASIVRVIEGLVAVSASREMAKTMSKSVPTKNDLVARADSALPSIGSAKTASAAAPASPGSPANRAEITGPKEVSVDEWEKHFVELKAGQQVTIGVDLFEQYKFDEKVKKDKFSQWIEKNTK
jgi:hypothetical protein